VCKHCRCSCIQLYLPKPRLLLQQHSLLPTALDIPVMVCNQCPVLPIAAHESSYHSKRLLPCCGGVGEASREDHMPQHPDVASRAYASLANWQVSSYQRSCVHRQPAYTTEERSCLLQMIYSDEPCLVPHALRRLRVPENPRSDSESSRQV
jgi:hypothetical protein